MVESKTLNLIGHGTQLRTHLTEVRAPKEIAARKSGCTTTLLLG
jgi:hypothetical protein